MITLIDSLLFPPRQLLFLSFFQILTLEILKNQRRKISAIFCFWSLSIIFFLFLFSMWLEHFIIRLEGLHQVSVSPSPRNIHLLVLHCRRRRPVLLLRWIQAVPSPWCRIYSDYQQDVYWKKKDQLSKGSLYSTMLQRETATQWWWYNTHFIKVEFQGLGYSGWYKGSGASWLNHRTQQLEQLPSAH